MKYILNLYPIYANLSCKGRIDSTFNLIQNNLRHCLDAKLYTTDLTDDKVAINIKSRQDPFRMAHKQALTPSV